MTFAFRLISIITANAPCRSGSGETALCKLQYWFFLQVKGHFHLLRVRAFYSILICTARAVQCHQLHINNPRSMVQGLHSVYLNTNNNYLNYFCIHSLRASSSSGKRRRNFCPIRILDDTIPCEKNILYIQENGALKVMTGRQSGREK